LYKRQTYLGAIAPVALLQLVSGARSTVIGGADGSVPPLPNAPPAPKLPALGGGASSIFLLFGSILSLAVLLAASSAQFHTLRRFAVEGGGPVGFAALLERPG
jgi:hypothetical protein